MSGTSGIVAGRYQLGLRIGAGATGAVYLATDTQTGERVAVKVLRSDLAADMPELLERFQREGEALRKLNHPNIVKVLATVEEGDRHCIVMEYVGGGSLADLLKQHAQLPLERVVGLALELSDALSRAHHLNIIHRDLKPANILLAEDGTPRLTDFGLARIGSYPTVTAAGAVLGTFQYLSPEACDYQPLDVRADIWSFGVVLYEMLTGQRPFEGDTPADIIWAIKNQPVPEVTWFRKDVPAPLADLVRRMLMKDRPARIDSVRLVGAELEAIQHGTKLRLPASATPDPVVTATPPPPSSAPQRPLSAQPPTPVIRVLIVDDHAVVRQGLRTFLDLQDDMSVVGEATNGVEAVARTRELQPDIVLLDLVMPLMDGVEATPRIIECSPATRVIILTSFGEDSKVFPAIRAGAQGYLLKDIPPEALVKAVRDAYGGMAQLHPDIVRKLMSAIATKGQPATPTPAAPAPAPAPDSPISAPHTDLTERELEVLNFIARGLNNHDIALRLSISEKTVKTHVSNILGKLHLEDRTQAAIYALKHGLVKNGN
jgi:DNA-binding NarL/FixJ family response regulator